MVELVEAGSPDSGYTSNSPRCATAESFGENSEQWPNSVSGNNTFRSKKDVNGSTIHSIKDETKLTNQNSTCIDGRRSTYIGVKRQNCTNLSAIYGDKLVTTGKPAARKRRHANRQLEEDENASPVLGIKILPARAVNPVSENDDGKKATKPHISQRNVEAIAATSMEDSGHFTCRLCAKSHSNALELAQHQCPRIVNVRYECSECGKNFGCPANLASHKRWHKPKVPYSDTMANPETKRRKLSISPVPVIPELNAVPECANLAATPTGPLPIVSQEERLAPSPSVRLKAIFPCPGCKRRFRRESNRRKHALVKHDIVIPSEPTTKQDKKLTSPPPKQVLPVLEHEQSMQAPPMRCSLATLALAAEAINGTSQKRPREPMAQPLDLTNKNAAPAPLSHGVDQILNLSKSKSFVPSQFPAINSVVSAHLKHRLLQGNAGFIQGAVGQKQHQSPTNSFQPWPQYSAQHLLTDYRYLAAIAADRMLACHYRM